MNTSCLLLTSSVSHARVTATSCARGNTSVLTTRKCCIGQNKMYGLHLLFRNRTDLKMFTRFSVNLTSTTLRMHFPLTVIPSTRILLCVQVLLPGPKFMSILKGFRMLCSLMGLSSKIVNLHRQALDRHLHPALHFCPSASSIHNLYAHAAACPGITTSLTSIM
jgi:hypothetical protein